MEWGEFLFVMGGVCVEGRRGWLSGHAAAEGGQQQKGVYGEGLFRAWAGRWAGRGVGWGEGVGGAHKGRVEEDLCWGVGRGSVWTTRDALRQGVWLRPASCGLDPHLRGCVEGLAVVVVVAAGGRMVHGCAKKGGLVASGERSMAGPCCTFLRVWPPHTHAFTHLRATPLTPHRAACTPALLCCPFLRGQAFFGFAHCPQGARVRVCGQHAR